MNDKNIIKGILIGVGSILAVELLVFLGVSLANKNDSNQPTPTPTPTAVVSQTPLDSVTPIMTTIAPSTSVSVTPTGTTTAKPTPTPSKYKYNIPVEAVAYEPDTNTYVGFRTCDVKNSMCTVYGVKASEIAKAVMGGLYMLSFNGIGSCGAALGTAYCPIQGEFQLK